MGFGGSSQQTGRVSSSNPDFVRTTFRNNDKNDLIFGGSTKGMSRPQRAFAKEGQNRIAASEASPEFDQFRQFLQDQFQRYQDSIPGIEQFAQGELDRATGQRDQLDPMLMQNLQALSGGDRGLGLTPELQGIVDQGRQLAIERSKIGVGDAFTELDSIRQARLGASGLGDSSISQRASSKVSQDLQDRLESARLGAEQQALERELSLRGQGQQGLIAGTQGIQNQMGMLQDIIGLSSPAGVQAILQELGGVAGGSLETFRQQRLANQLDALRIATGGGADKAGGGSGAMGALGSAAGGVIGALCFTADVEVLMADGSIKRAEDIKLNDETMYGGRVVAVGQALNVEDKVYDYNGVVLTGAHAVYNNGEWTRVKNTKEAKYLHEEEVPVFPIVNENHILIANGQIFSDFSETDLGYSLNHEQAIEHMNTNPEFMGFTKAIEADLKTPEEAHV